MILAIRQVAAWLLAFTLLSQVGADCEKILTTSRELRQTLYGDPARALAAVCERDLLETQWLQCDIIVRWRESGVWTSPCRDQSPALKPQRYYRLELECRGFGRLLLHTETILKR